MKRILALLMFMAAPAMASVCSNYSLLLSGITANSGTSSSTSIADNLDDLSVSVWLNYTVNPTNEGEAVGKILDLQSTAHHGWSVYIVDSRANFLIRSGPGADYFVNSSASINTGWHNIIATYDKVSGAKIYIDGTDTTVAGGGSPGGNYSNSVAINIGDQGSVDHLTGMVDEFRIWASTLTPTDAASIAAGGDAVATPLRYWRIEEGGGLITTDNIAQDPITFNSLAWSQNTAFTFCPNILGTVSIQGGNLNVNGGKLVVQ